MALIEDAYALFAWVEIRELPAWLELDGGTDGSGPRM